MESLSFDSMAELYDRTRVYDRDCFDSALDFLVERFPPVEYDSVLEPGIGTGRIAVPLAERGYRVTGIDISGEMLAFLGKRLEQFGGRLRICLQRADITQLPFANTTFDMAIVVHLFYFVKEWHKAVDEILRVTKRGSPVVLMHTGMGAEIPFLNSRYKELCAEREYPIESIGVRSTSEVTDYLAALGYHVEQIRNRWRWISCISLDEALGYVESRAYSFTTFAPDEVHFAVIEKLRTELRERFGSLAARVEVPNQIYFVFAKR
jgi:ubiquinone/menaquinone biosynthesis C-methylase UbiE